jgi:NAD(P)-dependent dehydrogenase (short-subunit alcohol dehydrogenase family)
MSSAMSHTVYPSLRNKRVVVTGGGSSIGAAIVESFAYQGAHVAFLDIAEAESRDLERRLAYRETRPRYYACDLTDVAAIRALFPHIREQLGPIDVLINNAANDDRHTVGDVTPAYWDERIAVNLRHYFF